jgi:hypothetical protein
MGWTSGAIFTTVILGLALIASLVSVGLLAAVVAHTPTATPAAMPAAANVPGAVPTSPTPSGANPTSLAFMSLTAALLVGFVNL